MKALTDEKLTIVGAAGMIGSNMAQTALMMGLTSNICLYDPFAPALEGVAEELEKEGFAKESIDTYLGLFKEITSDIEGVRYCKEKLKDVLDPKVAEDLETIISTVDSVKTADFKMSFDPTLVRGMSYYTGPIFEISMDEFGGSVGGGGRYDEMIGKFTGNNTSACGFSIGFERIVMLLLLLLKSLEQRLQLRIPRLICILFILLRTAFLLCL